MSEDKRRLSDEIRDAKAKLYYLLLLSSETKVYSPTKSDWKLIKRLSKDEQIQEPFKPMPKKATEPKGILGMDLLKLKKSFIVLITKITDANYLNPLQEHEILTAANKLHDLSIELITKPKTNGDEPK